MDTGIAMSSEMDIQKFWARRIAGPHHEEVTTADILLENQVLFPPAQVQVEDELITKGSRPSSSFCVPCDQLCFKEEVCSCRGLLKEEEGRLSGGCEVVDGSSLGDIPCCYTVPKCEPHEMTAIGVYVDPRIVPGFMYKIRSLSNDSKRSWLFGGNGRELESIGRGYSRRVTLSPLPGCINSNPDFFWTDSNPDGFAFSVQVLSPQDRFTLFNADHQPVAHLELTQIQEPQVEISQSLTKEGRVEKVVRVRALCKVDWFNEQENNPIIALNGVCVSVLDSSGKCSVIHIRDARLGLHPTRYGYSLTPGTCSSLRSLRVSGANIADIPTSYTIVGIEPYHLPIIGTYVDERIVPGFHYRVQLGGCGKKLFSGRALRLDSIGRGYAKRVTFSPDLLNSPDNHFWSDSHQEGFGFEISAVRPGMGFTIKTRDCQSTVGHAFVFRDDCAPQVELHHSTLEDENGICVIKRVQVDVKCEVSLDMSNKDELISHIMRVSGTATLYKPPKQAEAKILKIEDIGLDSQLNILFFNQWQELVFYPEVKVPCIN